jgi:hypothetical protein
MRIKTFAIALVGLPLLAACTVNNTPPDRPTTVVQQPPAVVTPGTTVVTPQRTVVAPAY